jgi:hypothetical protein
MSLPRYFAVTLSCLLAPATAEAASKVMFVTSVSSNGALGELAGADLICQARANAAGLGGTAQDPRVYRAWLSDDIDDAFCRVRSAAGHGKRSGRCGGIDPFIFAFFTGGPWVRTDGYPFSGNLFALTNEERAILTPPGLTEAGADVLGVTPTVVWTATNPDGTAHVNDCLDWMSPEGEDYGLVGLSHEIVMTAGQNVNCGGTARLYCFETGTNGDPLPSYEQPGGIVFITQITGTGNLSTWGAPGSGLAAADAVCRAAANAGHLPGADGFVAWLSATGVNAKDRLAIDGPWKRVDRVRVALSKADLTDDEIFTGIGVDEHGDARTATAWTGTSPAGTALSTRCADWLDGTAASDGTYGSSYSAWLGWTTRSTSDCDEPRSLYCFGNVIVLFWDGFETHSLSYWSSAVY